MKALIYSNGEKQNVFPVGNGLTIGSEDGNSIVLKSKDVEPRHAKVALVGPYVFLEDLDSRVGTLVNGAKIRRTALKDGDQIRVAGINFKYDENAAPAQNPPASKGTPAGKKEDGGSEPDPKLRTKSTPTSVPLPAPRTSSRRNSSQSGRIKLPGVGLSSSRNPSLGASGSRNPALISSSSSRNPAILKGSGAGSSRSGTLGSSSSHTPIPSSASFSDLEEAAKQLIDDKRSKSRQSQIPTKMTKFGIMGMIVLLTGVVLVVFLAPYWKNLQEQETVRDAAEAKEMAALERLRSSDPKTQEDLSYVRVKLKKAKSMDEVSRVLGEPHVETEGSISLWEPEKGTFEYQGLELKAYYLKEQGVTDAFTVRGILLFELDENGEVTFVGARRYALKETPPLITNAPPKTVPIKKYSEDDIVNIDEVLKKEMSPTLNPNAENGDPKSAEGSPGVNGDDRENLKSTSDPMKGGPGPNP